MKKIADVPTLTLCGIISIVLPVAVRAAQAAGLPADPNNAALLYYQAFLIRPEPDTTTLKSLGELMDGARPDSQVRMYLKVCQECIELARAASQLPYCDWGMRYSRGFGYQAAYLLRAQRTAHLLRLEALVLAADGDYRRAFEACLVMRRMARHIGDDTPLTYACAMGEDIKALSTIGHILWSVEPDAETLVWLKRGLGASFGSSLSLDRALTLDMELALQSLRENDPIRADVKRRLIEGAKDDQAKARLERLTDEDLLARAREPYEKYLGEALRVINSDRTYGDVYAELQTLTRNLETEYAKDPAASQIIRACAKAVISGYDTEILHTATLNALIGALDIYLSKAKTGQLPRTLPAGQAKDPYSGKDFDYVVTEKGFVLRCRTSDIRLGKPREFEFRVAE